jgi:hypothetical protein
MSHAPRHVLIVEIKHYAEFYEERSEEPTQDIWGLTEYSIPAANRNAIDELAKRLVTVLKREFPDGNGGDLSGL